MYRNRWAPLALFLAFGMAATGCVAAQGASYRSASYGRAAVSTVHYDRVHYNNTAEYRYIGRDADRYADFLDRELHLNSRQERDIERLLIDRTQSLLRNTRVGDHNRVYPFPRDNRSHADRAWWNRTDDYIGRMLNPYQRDEYRRLVYALDHGGAPNRPYGGYDYDDGRGYGR